VRAAWRWFGHDVVIVFCYYCVVLLLRLLPIGALVTADNALVLFLRHGGCLVVISLQQPEMWLTLLFRVPLVMRW
jgi:hypothetical protein